MDGKVQFPSPAELMDDVSREKGLDDFGDDSFKEGLSMLLTTVEREAGLDEAAANRLFSQIRQRLANRLDVEQWYRTHPEIEDIHVGPATSITGLPRTGTTALCNIMSLDTSFRSLRSWEQVKPCPPPILEEEESDPRRLATKAYIDRARVEDPEFAAMHLMDADATEEDVELLGMAFHAQQLVLPIFSYHAWWRDADLRPAFAWHRRVIKLLQSQRPPDQWLFKAPAHQFHLDAFFSAYPDSRVIVTHRDPAKAIPSAISLLCALQPDRSKIDLETFGHHHSEHLRIGVERAIAARARIGEDRFLDVHHKDFVRDPFGTLDRIYQFLGRELRPDVRAKMQEWHGRNRSGAHGTHNYTAEQFGLTAERIRSDFGFYIKQYDVPVG